MSKVQIEVSEETKDLLKRFQNPEDVIIEQDGLCEAMNVVIKEWTTGGLSNQKAAGILVSLSNAASIVESFSE